MLSEVTLATVLLCSVRVSVTLMTVRSDEGGEGEGWWEHDLLLVTAVLFVFSVSRT